ncbi:LAETG motif-containing sortase-dependent surface protein [Streptomyces sp. NPDC054796]
MRIRRALVTAAATAAIVPAALMAAPTAAATDSGGSGDPAASTTSTGSTGTGGSTATEGSTGSAGSTGTGGSTGSAGTAGSAAAGGSSAGTAGTGANGGTGNTGGTGGASAGSTSTGTTGTGGGDNGGTSAGTGGQEPGNSTSGGGTGELPGGGLCEDEDDEATEDADLTTTLHGLPAKVVAGSGFHTFTYRLTNNSDKDFESVEFGLFAAAVAEDAPDDEGTGEHLTLQYKDRETGDWKDISTDADDEEEGHIGSTRVAANGKTEVELRLSVDKKAPAGTGYAISVGAYLDEEDNCVVSAGEYYEFEIVAAGKGADEESPETKPQGGAKKPASTPAKSGSGGGSGGSTGELASTGSSDTLPAIGLTGAAAMVAGAGAVLVARRRVTPGRR